VGGAVMPEIAFELHNEDALMRKLASLSNDIHIALGDAMEAQGEAIMGISRERCPWKTGELRRSGDVTRIDEPTRTRIVLGYHTNYALYVHERQSRKNGWPINYSHGGTGSKYLEDPVNENKEKARRFLVTRMRETIAEVGK
jgi:hypothetical protein